MMIITSPAKTQQFNGRVYATHSLPRHLQKTKLLVDQLKKLDKDQLSSLMKTSEKLTDSTYQLIQNFELPFTPHNAKQALFTFNGDLYSAITALTYTEEQLQYAQEHLCILSGLYGIIRPLDLIQPYRLEMGCPLSTYGAKNLYQFWREQLTESLNQTMSKSADQVLVNLASKEYSKVVDSKKLLGPMIDVTFKQQSQGRYKTISIYAKRARGLMIHFAITNHLKQSKELKKFNLDGYQFSEEDSTRQEWLFYKK